jgi:hypothetical protein
LLFYLAMASRIYCVAVIVFWLATMTWLVVVKVAPALRRGESPDHHLASVERMQDALPVLWDMKWNYHPVGWAANRAARRSDGGSIIQSRVQFGEIQTLADLPVGLRLLVDKLVGATNTLALRLDNTTQLSPNREFELLDSSVRLNDDPLAAPFIRIQGTVENNRLALQFWVGAQEAPTSKVVPIPPQSLVSDEISPRGFMPNLRLHQEWTTYQVSPLPPPGVQKVVTAKVEHYEPIAWNGTVTDTLVVVYREDAGAGSWAADEYLGRLWVRPADGMVIKQEVILLGARLTFVRRGEDENRELAEQLEREWSAAAREAARPGSDAATGQQQKETR